MADATIEDLEIGTVLGDRHEIVARLGAGAMAVTYEAVHVKTGAQVAVKVMKRSAVRDAELRARFDREAAVMGRLGGSPTIVDVYDLATHHDGRSYIVMELVRGVNLQTELRELRELGSGDAKMPVARICRIALDVARALRDAHAAGVVHRDVKPSNIMLGRTEDGELAKLVDFGVSADLGKGGPERALTLAGVCVGTPEYMSPEQALGLDAAKTFDVYALGVTIYEMAMGKLPPHGIELSKGVPELDPIVESPELDRLVRACLEPDPADRVPSAEALVERLEAISADLERPTRRARVAWPIAAVAVLGVVGVLGVVAWTSGVAVDRVDPAVTSAGLEASAAAMVHTTGARASTASERSRTPDVAAAEVRAAPEQPGHEDEEEAEHTADAPPSDEPETQLQDPPQDPPQTPSRAVKSDAGCKAVRDEAERAKTAARWRDVLRATSDKSCWQHRGDRQRLRVEALLELKEYARCASEGAGARDPAVRAMLEFCTRNLRAAEASR